MTAIGHKLQSLVDIGRIQGVVMDLKVLDAVALAAKYALSVAIPLIVLVIAYRVWFHPLAKYPGPFAVKITSAYSTFYAWRRKSHIFTHQSLETYGPIVRIAPNRLVFQTVKAFYDVYANPKLSKGVAYAGTLKGAERPNIFNETNRDLHKKKRKIIGVGISERAMRVFEPEMAHEVDVFLGQLLKSSQNREVMDMTPSCEHLGVDIIGQLAFGFDLNSQRDPTHRAVSEGLKVRGRLGSLCMAWPALRYLNPIFAALLSAQSKNQVRGLYKSLLTMIGARMALPRDAKPDFYSHVSGDVVPGEPGLEGKDLWSEAVLIVAAGGSTTATTMTAALFYLSRYPQVYERLASEIRSKFSSAKEIKQGPQLSACTYLRAVIDESLRLSSGTISTWRVQDPSSVAAGETVIVDGHVIPPGTEVTVNAYCFMRNPEYYPEPFAFRPERWLCEDGETLRGSGDIARRAFVPFSVGSRSCAGQAMAYLELNLAIARTMWYFDFEKAPGEAGRLGEEPGQPHVFKLEDGTIVGHHGPNLVFKPRGDHWKELAEYAT